jgi:hypothetical protein
MSAVSFDAIVQAGNTREVNSFGLLEIVFLTINNSTASDTITKNSSGVLVSLSKFSNLL